jgi:hypothetical protein
MEVQSTRCTYDILSFGPLAGGTFQNDHIGYVHLNGGLDINHSLEASSTTIDSCDAEGSATLALTECKLGNLRYEAPYYEPPRIEMHRCVVLRDLLVGPDLGVSSWPGMSVGGTRTPGASGVAYFEGLLLERNTVVRRFALELTGGHVPPTRLVQDNLIGGNATVATPCSLTFTYNLIAGDLATSGPGTFLNNHAHTDPQFCNPAIGDYRIAVTSPALGGAHDGLAIGALGVGCTTVSVQPTTWGRLKALFH